MYTMKSMCKYRFCLYESISASLMMRQFHRSIQDKAADDQ